MAAFPLGHQSLTCLAELPPPVHTGAYYKG